jgi:hypothetical protein
MAESGINNNSHGWLFLSWLIDEAVAGCLRDQALAACAQTHRVVRFIESTKLVLDDHRACSLQLLRRDCVTGTVWSTKGLASQKCTDAWHAVFALHHDVQVRILCRESLPSEDSQAAVFSAPEFAGTLFAVFLVHLINRGRKMIFNGLPFWRTPALVATTPPRIVPGSASAWARSWAAW